MQQSQPQPVQTSSLLMHYLVLGAAGFLFSVASNIYKKYGSASDPGSSPIPKGFGLPKHSGDQTIIRRPYSTTTRPSLPSFKGQSMAMFPLTARLISARKAVSLTQKAVRGLTRR